MSTRLEEYAATRSLTDHIRDDNNTTLSSQQVAEKSISTDVSPPLHLDNESNSNNTHSLRSSCDIFDLDDIPEFRFETSQSHHTS
jgi:hypothetical protein